MQWEAQFLSSHLSSFSLPSALFSPAVRCCVCCGDRRAGAEPEPGDRGEAAVLWVCPDLAARHQPDELPENGEKGLTFGVPGASAHRCQRERCVCTRWCWHGSQAQSAGLFEGSPGKEKRDLRAGLSPALEQHQMCRFPGFAAEKLKFSEGFFKAPMFPSYLSSVLSELGLMRGHAVQLLRAQWHDVSLPVMGFGLL